MNLIHICYYSCGLFDVRYWEFFYLLVILTCSFQEKMANVGSLSALVKSLTRDVEEQREAVGLLLDLSDLPAVWRRIGRIQGCIVMLVSMLSGNDPVASHDAGKLLNALSSNTQNALHMAEAGYFKPLVQYLKEGNYNFSFISCV